MQTTQNYGYNMVESTDTANIPVQISPNFNKIDNDLKAVSDAAITSAVDTFASNTHALVRDDSDRNAIFFVAPADYVAGDVFTLDGVSMNVTDAAGNALESNAFRVNSVVFGIVYGIRLTLNVVNPVSVPPTPDASDVDYDNTSSGLTATDVQAAIDEIENQLNNLPAPTAGNTSYNNAISGLVATNVQQAIDELASGNSPTAFSAPVDILGYAWPTPYVAPSDGYLTALCWGVNSNVVAKIYGSNAVAESDTNTTINYTNTTANYYETTVFIKKGMKMFGGGRAGQGAYSLKFIPMT